MRNASGKSCRENQNTHFVFSNLFSPPPPHPHRQPENNAVCDVMCKNMPQPDKSRTAMKYGPCALHAGCLRQQAHTQNMWHFYPTAKMVAWTRPNVTFTDTFPVWRNCTPIYVYVFQMFSVPHISPPKTCTHSSSSPPKHHAPSI